MHIHWHVEHSANKYHKTRDLDDLGFGATTKDGFKCRFKQTKKGLHAHLPIMKEGGNVFGEAVN